MIVTLLVLLNITGFILVFADKRRAVRKQWRIPERTFFLLAAAGACPGIYAGMQLYRHKTRHLSFMLGIPCIFLLQLTILGLYLWI